MRSSRVLWAMMSVSILILRTSDARAAEKKSTTTANTATSTNTMGVTPPPLQSSSPAEITPNNGGQITPNNGGQITPNNGGQTDNTMTTMTMINSTTPGSSPNSETVPTTNASASNYSNTENQTTTPPPYIDMYNLTYPKVVNGTQFYPETTDMMDGLPLVPYPDDNDASNGQHVWLIYKIPVQAAVVPAQPNQLESYENYPAAISPSQPEYGGNYAGAVPPGPWAPYQNYLVALQPNQFGNYENSPSPIQSSQWGTYGNYPPPQPSQWGNKENNVNYDTSSTPGDYTSAESGAQGAQTVRHPVYEVIVQRMPEGFSNVAPFNNSPPEKKPLDRFFSR